MSSTGLVSVGDDGRGGIRASWSICCCRVSVQWGSRGSRRLLVAVLTSGSSERSALSGVVGVGSSCGVAASSATFNARSIACLSGESCVGVRGEPCGVNVGDTASSSIRVARSTLCSMVRDEVDWIVDRSSGLGPAKPRRWSVIVAIGVDRFRG
jgi:hypothetical protein